MVGAFTGQIVEGIDPEINQITKKFFPLVIEKLFDVPIWGWVLLGIGLGLFVSIWFDRKVINKETNFDFKILASGAEWGFENPADLGIPEQSMLNPFIL